MTTEDSRAGSAASAIKGRARAYVNAHYPEQATRVRDALSTVARYRASEERFRALERAVFQGVAADHSIHSWESKIHSQNGEDGILLHLFSRIGATSRRFFEFGCGTGIECNSANLALGFGWSGLLVDAGDTHIIKARTFFADHLGDGAHRVDIRCMFVTPDNVNDLLEEVTPRGGDLDLLSIDVDSIDYWIWRAVGERFRPRVVVTEYNASFGPDRSVTVASTEGFDPFSRHPSGFYHGASLEALRKVSESRGYQLIGCDSAGANAFFVRRDCADGLPDLTTREAWVPHAWRSEPPEPEQQFQLISHLPLSEV